MQRLRGMGGLGYFQGSVAVEITGVKMDFGVNWVGLKGLVDGCLEELRCSLADGNPTLRALEW